MNPNCSEVPLTSVLLRRRLLGVTVALLAAPALATPQKTKAHAAPAGKAAAGKGKAAPVHGGRSAASAASSTPAPRIVQREPALVPRLTSAAPEGPHYLDASALMRADISEGLPGVPMELRFVVVDQTAMPFAGALVEVWHCDAQGVYSGFAGQGDNGDIDARGRSFLRGRQATDRNGVAAFRTIYPGWHAGRTAHIHFKVWNGERCVLTSQLFLPDALSEYLFSQQEAYLRTRLRDTLNSTDAVALQAGNSVVGSVREEREQYVLTLAVAVDRSGRPAGEAADVAAPGAPASALRLDLDSPERRQALVPGLRR